MFVTGSVKGVPPIETVPYKAIKIHYIKIKTGNDVFYYGENGAMTDQAHAIAFPQKQAYEIAKSLKGKYTEVSVFGSTKKFQ